MYLGIICRRGCETHRESQAVWKTDLLPLKFTYHNQIIGLTPDHVPHLALERVQPSTPLWIWPGVSYTQEMCSHWCLVFPWGRNGLEVNRACNIWTCHLGISSLVLYRNAKLPPYPMLFSIGINTTWYNISTGILIYPLYLKKGSNKRHDLDYYYKDMRYLPHSCVKLM